MSERDKRRWQGKLKVIHGYVLVGIVVVGMLVGAISAVNNARHVPADQQMRSAQSFQE